MDKNNPEQNPNRKWKRHLNLNQLEFINEWFSNGRNGTKAYMAVYKTTNTTSANASSHALMMHPAVREEIERRKRELLQGPFKIDLSTQMEELKELIDSCRNKGFDGTGTMQDRKIWLAAVKEMNRLAGLIVPQYPTNDNATKTIPGVIINFGDLNTAPQIHELPTTDLSSNSLKYLENANENLLEPEDIDVNNENDLSLDFLQNEEQEDRSTDEPLK